MDSISADKILTAIAGGDLKSMLDDGRIVLLIDLKPIGSVRVTPAPQVTTGVDHTIRVMSGGEVALSVKCDDYADAEAVASVLAELLIVE